MSKLAIIICIYVSRKCVKRSVLDNNTNKSSMNAVFPLGSKSNRVLGERHKPDVGEGMASS